MVKPVFRPFLPSFKGLKINNHKILKDNQEIANRLADYFEKQFSKPIHDTENKQHAAQLTTYNIIVQTPSMSIDSFEIDEVYKQWFRTPSKKSTDVLDTSAHLLKWLLVEYLKVITVMYYKCALKGKFFEASVIAKVICLSKDGIYPSENRLRAMLYHFYRIKVNSLKDAYI